MISDILKLATKQRRERLSEPRQGLSLEAATETRAVHIRKAVDLLVKGFEQSYLLESFNAIFAPRWELDLGVKAYEQDISTRSAWNLICVWLLARCSNEIGDKASFVDSEEWFIGNCHTLTPHLSPLISSENLTAAKCELLKVSFDQDFWDLLPYILQELGAGSRAAVLRDPSKKDARIARKRSGIFYTPSDVADYMVKDALFNYTGDIKTARCFDPTCGTGVFFLSICREIEKSLEREDFNRFEYVTSNLFGCDISSHAIDACTFVLLHHCLGDIKKLRLSPWSAWHTIRLNLASIDSLLLTSSNPNSGLHLDPTLREKQKQMLLAAETKVMSIKEQLQNSKGQHLHTVFSDERMIEIGELFVEAINGFNILVGNPPYSKIGERNDYRLLSREYHSFADGRVRSQNSLFLPFIETMWRLTVRGQNSSALVTPLSIAYNGSTKFIECRKAMQRYGGRWKFAFFDREPHALFGEEVKTRNAILFRIENRDAPQRGQSAIIETGAMRKWTSRTRGELFNSINFTSLESLNIANGIPKVDGHLQSAAFAILRNAKYRFESFCLKIDSCCLALALKRECSNHVYVGGTAYNFLNVFRKFPITIGNEYPLSENPIHCLEFISEAEVSTAFAILSSRLVFWLWHVQADGFHVPGWFIRGLDR